MVRGDQILRTAVLPNDFLRKGEVSLAPLQKMLGEHVTHRFRYPSCIMYFIPIQNSELAYLLCQSCLSTRMDYGERVQIKY